ncbi:MAG TPA: response regulator transcription factor [Anaeromyxobacteraceae bacterium]|nr:response regulator transcription factor [Anaeromyxobacteraceae bacterium]
MSPTTVFVIDDHPLLREALNMLADAAGDLRVVGSSSTASGALEPLQRLSPDLILLDIDLGHEDGLVWLPRISSAAPRARVLILTALREPARDEEALGAGARGLVLKSAPPETLLAAIRGVAAGALWFDTSALGGANGQAPSARGKLASLTPREREIVGLIGEGLRNDEVARRLGITSKTVKNQLTTIFEKLGVSSRLELVVYAYNHGLARVRR